MINEEKFPDEFIQRMQVQLGSEFNSFVQSMSQPAPISVRFNPYKKNDGKKLFADEEKVTWCSDGRYLQERPSFTFDPNFHAGLYYVQEASSMFIEQIWKQLHLENKKIKALDLCAAPGGKSTHLLSLMSEDSCLVSNEVVAARNKILQQNISKWGTANCIVTQNKPEDFCAIENFFDVVLVDAPCSGEGLFRKDVDAINEWSVKNVSICSVRQQQILENISGSIKPGGFLIYSTCTFEHSENDDNIEKMLATGEWNLVEFNSSFENVSKTKFGWQFYPHKIKGEGFYISVLQKNGTLLTNPEINLKQEQNKNPLLAKHLQHPEKFELFQKNELLYAIPENCYNIFTTLLKHLYVRQAGICLGEIKGKDFLPTHQLALSIHISENTNSIELSAEDAILFLRGESPKLKTNLRGWCIGRFNGSNLGWMKLLDTRINNYYPKDLRILKRSV
jgi:16S rRNA C967 or C1407 C5-methylase (RsmB/RsmF family)/NOL1/NOP2/fmu family ribosome biogenesis protein